MYFLSSVFFLTSFLSLKSFVFHIYRKCHKTCVYCLLLETLHSKDVHGAVAVQNNVYVQQLLVFFGRHDTEYKMERLMKIKAFV